MGHSRTSFKTPHTRRKDHRNLRAQTHFPPPSLYDLLTASLLFAVLLMQLARTGYQML